MSTETDIAARFTAETAQHQMTILRNDGLYRHVRFMHVAPNPETGKLERSSFYWFDLLTWPGCLTVNGDCGTFTFSRTEDMFEFFRGGRINPQYWAEKVRGNANLQCYSTERFREHVMDVAAEREAEWPGLTEAAEREIFGPYSEWNTEFEDGAREALADFRFGDTFPAEGFRFTDTWQWELGDWDWQFLWCCHAIQWGIWQYDGCPAERKPEPAQAEVPLSAVVVLRPVESGRPVETVELPA